MELVFVYQKKRKDYGRQTLFKDKLAEITVHYPSDYTYLKHYIEKNPSFTEVQCVPEMSEHEVGNKKMKSKKLNEKKISLFNHR